MNQAVIDARTIVRVSAGIRILGHDRADLHEVRTILEDIALDDKHGASVIGRMWSFLRDGQSNFEALSIGTVIQHTLALSRSTVELARVKVETEIPLGIPRVRSDRVQLLQVLLNLVVNGCEAMSRTPTAERRLVMRVAEGKAEYVEIRVSTRAPGCRAAPSIAYSSRSSLRSRTAWGWGCRSVGRSSTRTAGDSGRRTHPVAARCFT